MQIHPESHVDHVPARIIDFILKRFQDRTKFFIDTLTLPEELPELECALYGPAMGDKPVPEADVTYSTRPGRQTRSRLIDRPTRKTRICTVIAGPYSGMECVLFTVYGGPAAPREPDDPGINTEAEREASSSFWKAHALAIEK